MKAGRDSEYISTAVASTRKLWDAIGELKALQAQATALDYANTLSPGEGANLGVVRADVIAVVFTTTDAFTSLLAQGHATNLCRLL